MQYWAPREAGLAVKQFNRNYHVRTPEGFVLINGSQIVKLEVVENGENWDVTFHLSDGTAHNITANNWTKRFVPEIIAGLKEVPKTP